jgi:hypothetical protein
MVGWGVSRLFLSEFFLSEVWIGIEKIFLALLLCYSVRGMMIEIKRAAAA